MRTHGGSVMKRGMSRGVGGVVDVGVWTEERERGGVTRRPVPFGESEDPSPFVLGRERP